MEKSKTTFRPILFSSPMVQAILEGRKTMTRRVVKLPNYHPSRPEKQINKLEIIDWVLYDGNKERIGTINCPYQVGDVLWVRETFQITDFLHPSDENYGYIYKASKNGQDWEDNSEQWKWKPSLFMPKSACRIFLKVKAIRVETLQDINLYDIINEGVQLDVFKIRNLLEKYGKDNPAFHFLPEGRVATDYEVHKLAWADLWISINGIQSWNSNPYIWVYEFERIEKPLDFIL